MKKYYNFAGAEIEIDIPQSEFFGGEKALDAFEVKNVENPHYFRFIFVNEFDEPEGEELAVYSNYRVYKKDDVMICYMGSVQQSWETAYIKIIYNDKNHMVLLKNESFPNGMGEKTVLTALMTEHLIADAGGFILHASYIEYEGEAILFTGESGIGKTTQAQLWEMHRGSKIINGDRVAVMLRGNEFYAAGIPYSGSSKYCKNKILPIKAIVSLQQSMINKIEDLGAKNALGKILGQTTLHPWNEEEVEAVMNIICSLIETVPVYQLSCTPDEAAVKALHNKLY